MRRGGGQIDDISRRKFLSRAIVLIGGAVAAAIGVPAIAYVTAPTRQQAAGEGLVGLGPAASVEVGVPTLLKATVERQTGWLTDTQELSVFVTTDNGVDFVALSNICTHLGCRVRWVGDQGEFFCPCHNGVFSADGAVVSGPPPRPLDRYDTVVQDGQLFIDTQGT